MTNIETSNYKNILKWLIIFASFCLILNIILLFIQDLGHSEDLRGNIVEGEALRTSLIRTLCIGISVIGLIIGVIFAFIPYKNYTSYQKFALAFTLTHFVLQSIFFLFQIKTFKH